MSTSQQTYGSNVYPGWVWVLPNGAFDQPDVMSIDRDGVVASFSIREYLAQPEANVGMFKNRSVKAFDAGTHSMAVFDSDISDILGFTTMLDASGLTNGDRDFTLNSPTVYYDMPISKYDEFIQVSPLYNAPTLPEEPTI